MTITVTDIEQGPFVATGAAQTISYTFMTLTEGEINVLYVDDSGSKVLVDPINHKVIPNKDGFGEVREGGVVELDGGAVPSGASVYVEAAPLATRHIQWSDQGSRLRSMNEEQDRDALRALVNSRGFMAATATANEALSTAEAALDIATGTVGDWVVLDKLNGLKEFSFAKAPMVYVRGRLAAGDGYFGAFIPVEGDQSAKVASDPTSALWVAPYGEDGSGGAWMRVYDGPARVEWFGGNGNGVADNAAALTAMAASVGYVCLSRGRYRVRSAITVDVPIQFEEGALDIDVDVIVTLRHRIDAASNRQIIYGAGNILFDNAGGLSGEAAKEAHAAWWGVKVGQWHGDQAPIINKAFSSLGNTREGVMYFANGTHRMESTAFVPRCVTVKGLRPRTTLFYPMTDGWPVFETTEDGCGFEGIQFENNRSVMPLRQSPLIHVKHTNAYVDDVMLTTCAAGILVEGEGFRGSRIGWNHDAADGVAGTYLIKLTRGRAQIRGLYGYLGKTYGVASLILIEPSAFMAGVTIRDVDSACWSRVVLVNATSFSINGLSITGLNLSPQTGQNAANAIEVNVASGQYISNVNINDANINARFNDGITINVANGATLSDVNIDNVNIAGSSAASTRTGIKVTMGAGSTGSIARVKIGGNRNVVRPAGQEVVVPTGDSRVNVSVL